MSETKEREGMNKRAKSRVCIWGPRDACLSWSSLKLGDGRR